MTVSYSAGNVLDMAKRQGVIPRDGVTPLEYKIALARKIKDRRKELGLTHEEVASQLTRAVGREIRADSYRQWETVKSIVQVDAILPLCDILRIHVYELLGSAPKSNHLPKPEMRGKAVA